MHQRFAAHEEQVADAILHADVDHIARFLQRDAAALLGIELVNGEIAEVAPSVAKIRDGKLEVARSAIGQHLAHQLEDAFLGAHHRSRNIVGRRGGGGWFDGGKRDGGGGGLHSSSDGGWGTQRPKQTEPALKAGPATGGTADVAFVLIEESSVFSRLRVCGATFLFQTSY